MLTKASRYGVVVGITILTFSLEIYGSYSTHSHGLLADALHLLGDGIPFMLGWYVVSVHLAVAKAEKMETWIMLLNAMFLWLGGMYIAVRALGLLFAPVPVESTVLLYAVVGFFGNGAQLYFAKELHDVHHHEHTHRSQMLHLWADLASSVGVIIGAVIVAKTGFVQADSYAALLVAMITLWAAWKCFQGITSHHEHHRH